MSLGWSLRSGFTSWPHSLGSLPRPQHTSDSVAHTGLVPCLFQPWLAWFPCDTWFLISKGPDSQGHTFLSKHWGKYSLSRALCPFWVCKLLSDYGSQNVKNYFLKMSVTNQVEK